MYQVYFVAHHPYLRIGGGRRHGARNHNLLVVLYSKWA